MPLQFEWNQAKNLANQRKHRLSFEEASEAFHDPLMFTVPDRIEDGEYRWQAFGVIRGLLLVMVAYTMREYDDVGEVIRIISARYATRQERQRYERETG